MNLDPEKVEAAIERTRNQGVEHAFIRCEDGTESPVVPGRPDGIQLPDTCPLDEIEAIFHTHVFPGVTPSHADEITRKVIDPDVFCIGDIEGTIACSVEESEDDDASCWGH